MQARGRSHSGYYGPSRATPQTPLLATLVDRADFPSAPLSPRHWYRPNFVGSALPEGKSAPVAATRNTQTGSCEAKNS